MKKTLIIIATIIAVIAIAFVAFMWYLFGDGTWLGPVYEITEIKYITSPHQIEFRIEYEHNYFPDSEYFAIIYASNAEGNVGYVKLFEMYSQKDPVNPDP